MEKSQESRLKGVIKLEPNPQNTRKKTMNIKAQEFVPEQS